MCVFNLTRQSFLSLEVGVADTQWMRLRGLLGRLRLRNDDGLWVVPSQGVHTIGLMFPVDLVYLDADSRVVQVVEHLSPFRVGPLRRRARSVLELPTRSVFCSNTQIGDQFIICSPQALAAHLSDQGSNGRGGPVMSGEPKQNPDSPARQPNGSSPSWLKRLFRAVSDRRRAARCAIPGVAAYYWEGGSPEPHDVLNLSASGAYIRAAKRWLPGTIIELSLQAEPKNGDHSSDSRIAVQAPCRVVRCDADGVGVRFLLTNQSERAGVRKLLAALKDRTP